MTVEKMGFEKDRRVRKQYRNRRITATVGGQTYDFKSLFEWHWAQYLQILVNSGEITGWQYEPQTFHFGDVLSAPVKYTPDFHIFGAGSDPNYWQETKGHHDGPTNSKLKRMATHYPDEIMELVLQGFSKKTAARRDVAERFTRRVMDGKKILRVVKGMIQWKPLGY